MIGRGGWLRVPEESLRTAGIGERAIVRVRPGVIELHPAGDAAAAVVYETPPTAAGVLVEARGVTRRFGHETALELRRGLSGRDAHGRHGAVRLRQVDAPRAPGRAGHTRRRARSSSTASCCQRSTATAAPPSVATGSASSGRCPGSPGVLTARENVKLALTLHEVDGLEARERAMDALAIVEAADSSERAVDRLSAGERERVALARAIAGRPSVLVADEPTARLDSLATLAVAGLLADLAREHGTTVICAAHDPIVVTLAGAEIALRRSSTPLRST